MSEDQEPSEEHFDFDDDFPPPKGGALKVVIILGIIGAGGFGLLSALKGDGQGTGEFSIEDQVAELSQLIGDKSCTNAQTLFDKLMKRELNPLERRMVQNAIKNASLLPQHERLVKPRSIRRWPQRSPRVWSL